jgi:hypothetical protein
MDNAINTAEETLIILVASTGWTLTYSVATDRRVTGAEDGKLLCRSAKAAGELAGEMRAFGVAEARDLGHAVVFWA